ncbi:MAG TPA: CoA pyrophosphatase [Spirochaetota bacterium]|nr:CoA pyrophosphatase [Spirochaetota bacterium]HPJ43193.1 CoA pyrophosphatase [Spirochaetota bacterium]
MNSFKYSTLLPKLPDGKGILGREKYFNSVVFVPFVEIDGEWNLLFQQRSSTIRQPDEVSFPGGGFSRKKDRNCMDTAIRETVEELGIAQESIVIEGRLDSIVAPMGAIIEIFLGRITDSDISSYNINKDEVAKVFAVPFRWFLENDCETYKLSLEIKPYMMDSSGEKEGVFPAKELGLPERYAGPWKGIFHEIHLYRTEHGVIWGLTAEIVRELVRIAKK